MDFPNWKILIISNVTCEPFLGDSIKKICKNTDIAITYLTLNELYQNRSVLNNYDILVVYIDVETISGIYSNYILLSNEERASTIKMVTHVCFDVLATLQESVTDQQVLWLDALYAYGKLSSYSLDDFTEDVFNRTIDQLNANIRDHFNDCFVHLDMNSCVMAIGARRAFNSKYYYAFQNPFSILMYDEIAYKIYRALYTKYYSPKKCIVLDCDNTLWGGIISEHSDIQIGNDYPGNCFSAFQNELLKLYHSGFLLTICSKNDEDDVLSVLQNDKRMCIKPKHIAAYKINWNPKSQNILKLSEELNISVESMLFIDDEEREINEVKYSLPNISTLHLDSSYPHKYARALRDRNDLIKTHITCEDKVRTALYHQQSKRKRYENQYRSHLEYLKSLETQVRIHFEPSNFTRLAQLSQRANKFNISDVEYSESDLCLKIKSTSNEVISIEVSDIFGDLGMIGLIVLSYREKRAVIEAFILSCRALGRYIEQLTLKICLTHIIKKGYDCLEVVYKDNNQNHTILNFFLSNGFSSLNAETLVYNLTYKMTCPDIFDVIKILEKDE